LTRSAADLYAERIMNELEGFRDRGVRALVLLHERELRTCLVTWRRALAWGVELPATGQHDASPQASFRHVLSAAGGYLRWLAEHLELGDPGLDAVPGIDDIEDQAEAYLEHLLGRWRTVLRDVPRERLRESYPTKWVPALVVEAMLEHAVVHPMRHTLQLEGLMTPS
jgi:hypothetical protein